MFLLYPTEFLYIKLKIQTYFLLEINCTISVWFLINRNAQKLCGNIFEMIYIYSVFIGYVKKYLINTGT